MSSGHNSSDSRCVRICKNSGCTSARYNLINVSDDGDNIMMLTGDVIETSGSFRYGKKRKFNNS